LLKKRETAWILFAIILGTIVALWCAERTQHVSGSGDIEFFADGRIHEIHGWIIEDPDVRPTETRLVISVDRINKTTEATGRVLITELGGYPSRRYGNEVIVYGKLRKPEAIGDFDYPRYLELSGIRAVMQRAKVTTVQTDGKPPRTARTFSALGLLYDLRSSVENRIGVILPEPQASLLAGLLTGSRRGLSDKLSDNFRIAGITHIIAISGYNITIILALMSSFLFWLPIKKRFWPLIFMVTCFTFFVGAGAPVVRASIMGILGLLALQAERVTIPRLTILWTAFIMLLWNPMQLWYDASFQLSFLAIAGITEVGPCLKKIFARVPEKFAIRESLVATMAAQIGTLPVSILIFRQFSLISPLTNILVAPLIPLAMLTGTVALLLSYISMPLALVAGYVSWLILQTIILIAHVGAMTPLAAISW
jgi:competence protein ComEC